MCLVIAFRRRKRKELEILVYYKKQHRNQKRNRQKQTKLEIDEFSYLVDLPNRSFCRVSALWLFPWQTVVRSGVLTVEVI